MSAAGAPRRLRRRAPGTSSSRPDWRPRAGCERSPFVAPLADGWSGDGHSPAHAAARGAAERRPAGGPADPSHDLARLGASPAAAGAEPAQAARAVAARGVRARAALAARRRPGRGLPPRPPRPSLAARPCRNSSLPRARRRRGASSRGRSTRSRPPSRRRLPPRRSGCCRTRISRRFSVPTRWPRCRWWGSLAAAPSRAASTGW